MRRRQVLTAAALSAASLAGCTGPGATHSPTDDQRDTGTDEPTATAPVTPPENDPILFVLRNQSGAQRTVSLTLTGPDGRRHLDESVTLGNGDIREYDSGIRSPGDYELAVTVENGPDRTMTLYIEAYDVRMGSNHLVTVHPDEIDVFWEE
ncbi:hypothetical protein [Haloarcula sp. JP-L23]|uniref:hypothetical protein n=1 Tax=Haloarcula sp. JP-L23 TaxID=2716717 RepID=UPI00140F4AC8|nr:hypothetical protein G9465_08105 [Haloarcula sp. JP-L23]